MKCVQFKSFFALVFFFAAMITTVGADNCVSVPGLVSWWPADIDGRDIAGTNNGVLTGGVQIASGKVGNAFAFNGSSYVEIASSPSLLPTNGFSIEAWISPTQGGDAGIFTKWSDSIGRSYFLGLTPDLALSFAISDEAHENDPSFHGFVTTNNIIPLNTWTHVVAVYDSLTGKRKMYINGAKVAERTDSPIVLFDSPAVSMIGARVGSTGSATSLFVGSIDEVSLYNRALTDTAVLALFNAQSAGKCERVQIATPPQDQTVGAGNTINLTVLVAGTGPFTYQWLFKGNVLPTQTNATLQIPNAQTSNAGEYTVIVSGRVGNPVQASATVTITDACIAPPPGLISWWPGEGNGTDVVGPNSGLVNGPSPFAPGKVGSAFSFSGEQYIELTNSPILNVTGSLSIEAWIYPTSSSLQTIFGKWSDSVRSYILNLNADNSLLFGISDTIHQSDGAFHTFTTVPGVVPLNKWTHVAAVYDQATGTRQIFVNGVKTAERTDPPITISTSTTSAAIGARISGLPSSFFYGKIDEVSLYGRALTSNEIAGIFTADISGKCLTTIAPFIITQPQPQSVQIGNDAAFSVVAGGTAPSYQWVYNGDPLSGQTNSSLSLTKVQLAQAGAYSVIVSNSLNSVVSSNATLTVTLPPSSLRIVNASATNGTVIVPIQIVANGSENSLAFSVSYTPSRLAIVSAALGENTKELGGSFFVVNTNQIASGRVGFVITLPSNSAFPAGTNEVMLLTFHPGSITTGVTTPIVFGDAPVVRQVTGTNGAALQASYALGTVFLPFIGLEGDIDGDNVVKLTDWQAIGRMVVGLDTVANGTLFQKVDVAPRATFGDGYLTVADWVQASRYSGGLDLPTGVAGPVTNLGVTLPLKPATNFATRKLQVSAASGAPNATIQLPVILNAIGGENAVGFSLRFNPADLAVSRVTLGAGASTGVLVANTNLSSNGLVGVAVALPSGATFAAGTNQVAIVEFVLGKFALGTKAVEIVNVPAIADVADPSGTRLPTSFIDGQVTFWADQGTPPFAPLITGTVDDFGNYVEGMLSADPTVVLRGLAEPGSTVTVNLIGGGQVAEANADTNGVWIASLNRRFNFGTNTFTAFATRGAFTSATSDPFPLVLIDARLSSLSHGTAGQTQLNLKGTTGMTYQLQISQDLRSWGDVGNPTILTNDSVTLVDPTNGVDSANFYRVRVSR